MQEEMVFQLRHEQGKLYAVVHINGVTHEQEVTSYFKEDNPHDDWLDYRIFGNDGAISSASDSISYSEKTD